MAFRPALPAYLVPLLSLETWVVILLIKAFIRDRLL